jgi:hypothetical protein
MHEIRYFGYLVDPRPFRRGHGWRGVWIFVLNAIRTWLERRVVLAVLRLQLRGTGLKGRDLKAVMEAAKHDPQFIPGRYHPIIQEGQRRTSFRAMLDEVLHGRKEADSSAGPAPLPVRPMTLESSPLVGTLADYQRRYDRGVRYYRGRGHYSVFEPEDPEHKESD